MTPHPPRLARLLASLLIRGEAHETIVGDLDQEFHEQLANAAPVGAARRHYWRQTLTSIAFVLRPEQKDDSMLQRLFVRPFHGLSLDLKSVMRVLRRSPGYAAVAVLSLAIGIGANTAIVSVVRQMLNEPLPVERATELRLLFWNPNTLDGLRIRQLNSTGVRDAATGISLRSNYTYSQFRALQSAAAGAAEVAGYTTLRRTTVSIDGGDARVVSGMLVSGNFFSTVRPPIAIGRGLMDTDDRADAPAVAVISYSLWTRLFNNSPDALTRTVRVNNTAVPIVGVTAAPYRGLSRGGFAPDTDVTLTLSQQPTIAPEWNETPGVPLFNEVSLYWVRALMRVRPGGDAQAVAAITPTLRGVLAQGGLTTQQADIVTPRLFPGERGNDALRTAPTQQLRLVSIVVGVVLLIACINVAGLMLARGVSRQRELALRRALGASRMRIARELLLESVLVSLTGGFAGLVLALWAAPALQSLLSAGVGSTGISVALDWKLLRDTAGIACTAGLLAGLLPALRFSRNTDADLKNRTSAGTPKLFIGRALLALQIAVSLPLVAGAGLFLKTLHNLGSVELGFNPQQLAFFTADPTMNGKMPERRDVVFPRLLERLESIPGIDAATVLENALISGFESDTTVTVGDQKGTMYINGVGPHFSETMGVPLIAGRQINAHDTRSTQTVIVINQSAVRKYFGNASPLGAHLRYGTRDAEVVGVITDTKYLGIRDDVPPTMLQSYQQRGLGSLKVMVRSSLPSRDLRQAIEQAVKDTDASMPIADYKTQVEQIGETIGKERVFTRLLTIFGGFALLLACVGLHGVTSYSVARRTSEIGIRLALGAQRSQVLWMVLRQVIVLAFAGLLIGVPLAWLAGPVVRSYLYGLEPTDPFILALSAIVMIGIAVAAGVLPARRAARMEALAALRAD